MNDLMYIMSNLVDVNGKILVPGVYDKVQKLTDEELKTYDPIDFDMVSVCACWLWGCTFNYFGYKKLDFFKAR